MASGACPPAKNARSRANEICLEEFRGRQNLGYEDKHIPVGGRSHYRSRIVRPREYEQHFTKDTPWARNKAEARDRAAEEFIAEVIARRNRKALMTPDKLLAATPPLPRTTTTTTPPPPPPPPSSPLYAAPPPLPRTTTTPSSPLYAAPPPLPRTTTTAPSSPPRSCPPPRVFLDMAHNGGNPYSVLREIPDAALHVLHTGASGRRRRRRPLCILPPNTSTIVASTRPGLFARAHETAMDTHTHDAPGRPYIFCATINVAYYDELVKILKEHGRPAAVYSSDVGFSKLPTLVASITSGNVEMP